MSPLLIWIVTALAVLAPGIVVRRLCRFDHEDPLVVRATETALGLSVLPILFLWSSLAGLHWRPFVLEVVAALFLAAAAAVVWVETRPGRGTPSPEMLGFLAVLAATVATRALAVRALALPAWVDSLHHTMIARLLAEDGTLPASYAPFIPSGHFYYHWGYHVVPATVAILLRKSSGEDLAAIVLHSGQALGCLVALTVYAAARVAFGSRRAGVIAALCATLVSYFPAYYASWGRYTHLAGAIVLALLVASMWEIRWDRAAITTCAIGSAGLVLIHARLALFAATLGIVLAAWRIVRGEASRVAALAVASVVAAILVLPWATHLSAEPGAKRMLNPHGAAAGEEWTRPNEVSADLLWAPRNPALFSAATGGLWGMIAARRIGSATLLASAGWWLFLIWSARRKPEADAAVSVQGLTLLAGWCLLTALLINLASLGIGSFRWVSNDAAVITLFLPASIATGGLAAWSLERFGPRTATVLFVLTVIVTIAIASPPIASVVNDRTIIATVEDVHAMRWIEGHTPTSAVFAINARPWLGGSYIGTDGGYWIALLTGRRSILPPALYTWVADSASVRETDELCGRYHDAGSIDDPGLLAMLRRAGVTHFYAGSRATPAERMRLASSNSLARVYNAEGVEIYALRMK